MALIDWWIVAAYLLGMLLLATWLGRSQGSRNDYYLAGGSLPAPALAVSILATQCSTNSLLGAPAFVGFATGGGLIWLQYELAVPLAMLVLVFLFPLVYRFRPISVYAVLEARLGRATRLVASGCFLFSRGVGTGITAYGVASVLALVMDVDYLTAILLLMGVTIVYDVLGGMRAVVVSDVVQMVLLVATVLLALSYLLPALEANHAGLAERTAPLLNDWGVTGTTDYGVWPMLFGGLFLYVAYYGFDQSQAQRLLSASDDRSLRRILLLNGLLRFPLVLAYCILGLGLAAYALDEPTFLAGLPTTAQGEPNINLVFPYYVLEAFPAGLAGLAIVGLFAAAMSSLDSALNSLSASTLEDFLPAWTERHSERDNFLLSKVLTLAWGGFAVAFSFSVEQIASTVLEAINKVGSLVFGPLLGLFLVALVLPAAGERRALAGFIAGVAANGYAWIMLPQLSWLWWNVLGCAAVLLFALTALPRLSRPVFAGLTGVASTATALLVGALLMLFALLILQLRSGVDIA